ncbi:unnamed protein product [Caenorhabditis angaria]|uniref:DUF4440 domain-containing protein n=1 Tax=Caenorhabditis angaria TaxID=860376 RepID=A0A9P1IZP9_9PELO|nr:unnamed protein product [Caenorhabditis angaria]
MSQEELRATLAPYFEQFNKSTEIASAEDSMKLMHPQAVIVQKDTTSTFGKEALTALFKSWYKTTGPYYFERSSEKYSGSDDWIVVEAKMRLTRIEDKTEILHGDVMHIWKKENNTWLMFYEQFHVANNE